MSNGLFPVEKSTLLAKLVEDKDPELEIFRKTDIDDEL
jgi:hypothetical protein